MNGEDQGYGNEQAIYTMNRAAYGDVPAALIGGGGRVGGATYGLQNMLGDVGRIAMPIQYAPPARAIGGQYGEYSYQTGFFKSLGISTGLVGVPRGTMAADYVHAASGDLGERVGSGVVGAAAVLASLPVAAAMRPFASLAGRAVGAAAGSGIGGLVAGGVGAAAGGGIGGAVGGFIGGVIAPYMLAAAATGAVTDAIGERRQIQGYLEQTSHRWVGAGSTMADQFRGTGMSQKAAREVGEFIRELDIKDKMVNTEDLTNILKGGTQMGLFTGTRDMEDFKRRFKDITENVKQVTKLLHTTLEEGLKTMADLKAVGIDPSKAAAVTTQAAALGATAGRTAQEMIGIGLQGAELYRGTGVQMGIGFQAAQMNTAAIRASRDAGLLSQEAIAQAGGEEALAMRMTAGGLAFGQSTQGRGFAAAFFQPGQGLNQAAFMQNMMTGGGNFIQNVQNAAQNLGNPARLIEFQANQERIMEEMGKKFGGRGLEMAMLGSTLSYAEYMANQTGASKEDAFRLALKQQGKSHSEIDAYMAQIRDPEKVYKSLQEGVEATANKRKIDEASENFVLNRLGSAVGDKIKGVVDMVAKPLNETIDDIKEGTRRVVEEQVYGVVRGTTKGVDMSVRFEKTDEVKRDLARLGPTDLSQKGLLARTAGGAAADLLKNKDIAAISGVEVKTTSDKSKLGPDDVILETSILGETKYVKRSEYEKGSKNLQSLQMTEEEARGFEKAGALGKGKTITELFAEGKAAKIQSTPELLKEMFGKTNVSREEMAFAILETKGTSLEKILSDTRSKARESNDITENINVTRLKQARDEFDTGKSMLEKRGDIKLADGVAELLAKADELSMKDPAGSTRYINEAKALQAKKTGEPLADIDKKINKAYGGSQLALEKIRVGHVAMEEVQQARGASAISRSLESELMSEKGVKLDEKVRQQASDAAALIGTGDVSKIKAVLESKELTGALEKLDTGAGIVKQARDITDIEKKLSSGIKSDAEVRDVLKGTFKNEEQLRSMVSLYKSQGKDAVVNEALKSFQENMATAGGVSSASGKASTAEGSELQSASQNAAIQTSMNQQTLMAMQALAARLGVK